MADSADMLPFDAAVRSRRTHKVFGREPVPRATLDELFELARWAPNHHLTQPWRFRVVGPRALAALKAATDDGGVKLERAPTLIVASVVRQPDPVADQEDLCAAACACFIVLTAAHVRGLAGYWRTPAVLRTEAGLEAVGVPDDERLLGLLHLGPPAREAQPPERLPAAGFVRYLD
ncbi:MAG TPA: nitroreductase family protein [Gaiellales bacterium]|nr:nitroreductase family protein [Gaiellales bacterium]